MVNRVLLIVNPKAGRAKAERYVKLIVDAFHKLNFTTTIYYTKQNTFYEDVEFLLKDQYNYLICVGGDGTLSMVVNAIKNNDLNIPILYLPGGTANDFARNIGLKKNILANLDNLKDMKIHSHDIAKVDNKYFDYVLGFGALVDVSSRTSRKAKNMFGPLSYFFKAFKEVTKIRKFRCKVEVDGNVIEDDFALIMVTNSYYVGGLKLQEANEVELNDGKFEVYLYKMPKKISRWMKIVGKIITQNYPEDYIMLQGSDIKLSFEDINISSTVDGEIVKFDKNVKINVINKGIRLLY